MQVQVLLQQLKAQQKQGQPAPHQQQPAQQAALPAQQVAGSEQQQAAVPQQHQPGNLPWRDLNQLRTQLDLARLPQQLVTGSRCAVETVTPVFPLETAAWQAALQRDNLHPLSLDGWRVLTLLVCRFIPSADGINQNLLLLLHGLGDTPTGFTGAAVTHAHAAQRSRLPA